MSHATTALITGLAQMISNAQIGVYRPLGGYLGTDTAIFLKSLPEAPDRAIAVTAYSSSDMVKINESTVRVQLWFRGVRDLSTDVDDLADDVFDLLQGMEHFDLGDVHVIQIYRVSSGQLGTDLSKRSERTDNYALDINVPTTPGRPG